MPRFQTRLGESETEREMPAFTKKVTDPHEALRIVGGENTELNEELQRVYAELDLYRDALTVITLVKTSDPGEALSRMVKHATLALSGKRDPGWDATLRAAMHERPHLMRGKLS